MVTKAVTGSERLAAAGAKPSAGYLCDFAKSECAVSAKPIVCRACFIASWTEEIGHRREIGRRSIRFVIRERRSRTFSHSTFVAEYRVWIQLGITTQTMTHLSVHQRLPLCLYYGTTAHSEVARNTLQNRALSRATVGQRCDPQIQVSNSCSVNLF